MSRWAERVEDIGYALRRPRWFLRQKVNAVKWFIQRGRRGYSDHDLYSFDYYLIPLLIEVLPKYTNEGEFGRIIHKNDPDTPANDFADAESNAEWNRKVLESVAYLEEWWNTEDFYRGPLDVSRIEYVIRNIQCFWW